MLLTPDPRKMKLVFLLSAELKAFPEQVAAAQKLTLNELKPYGLKGSRGLFGSQEWWDNIAQDEMKHLLPNVEMAVSHDVCAI